MNQELEKHYQTLLERKSWLQSMLSKNDDALMNYRPFKKDAHLFSDEIAKNEKEYQEMLIHLRACHNEPIVNNATPMPYFPADMFDKLDEISIITNKN